MCIPKAGFAKSFSVSSGILRGALERMSSENDRRGAIHPKGNGWGSPAEYLYQDGSRLLVIYLKYIEAQHLSYLLVCSVQRFSKTQQTPMGLYVHICTGCSLQLDRGEYRTGANQETDIIQANIKVTNFSGCTQLQNCKTVHPIQ